MIKIFNYLRGNFMKKFLGVLAICICINNLFAQEKPNVVVAPFESIDNM